MCWLSRILVLILAVWMVFWACQGRDRGQESASPAPELKPAGDEKGTISIRNQTSELIEFTVQPHGSSAYPLPRILAVGEIHSLSGGKEVTITFHREGEIIRTPLKPGMACAFVYDHEGAISLKEGWQGKDFPEDLAPFLGSPLEVVDEMLRLAQVGPDDILFDLGCGDGRIVIRAARRFGTRGVGIDYNPRLIDESRQNARASGVADLVDFRVEDITKADFSEATVVTLYLLTHSNARMRPLFEEQLQSGTRIVAHNYQIPGWETRLVDRSTVTLGKDDIHTVFLYRR